MQINKIYSYNHISYNEDYYYKWEKRLNIILQYSNYFQIYVYDQFVALGRAREHVLPLKISLFYVFND